MIEAVYEVGRLQERADFLDEFIDDIGKNYKYMLKIKVYIEDRKIPKYMGVDLEEIDVNKKLKYFYKKGSSKGTDKTPTSKITELDKTLKTKIVPIFKNILEENKQNLTEYEKEFLQKMDELISKNQNKISDDLKELVKNLNKKDAKAITFVFIKNGKEKYVGDMDIFADLFKRNENEAYKRFFYSKSNKTYSKAKKKMCYICGNEAEEVWGFVNTYNFYNVDKTSYIAGGFKREFTWKNYPVCPECAKTLERGKKYIDERLSFKFCTFNYYLIPQLVIEDNKLLKSILGKLRKYKDFSLSDKKAGMIENVEEAILRELSSFSNQVNFNFLFYEKSNNAFKILLYMQEVAPSRLKFLIESKDQVDDETEKKHKIFAPLTTKNKEVNLDFSFSFIKEFFQDSKATKSKKFLSILNNIFISKPVSFEFLISKFLEKISLEFLKDLWIEPTVLKSYKILLYLEKINLLERRKHMSQSKVNKYEDFFKENVIFDDDLKKALFLEGVLAQKLLNIQFQERNSTPFRSRLNGLKIDEKTAKRLLPEIINKLEEYGKNYYKQLESLIGEYMLNDDFSKYSVDEISYYFTLGMVLEKHFKNEENNQVKGV